MQRCVVIHANGTSEVIDFKPKAHQELRHLGYRRFVIRTTDGRALSAAVYARTTPSSWQFGDAARKMWGLVTGDVEAFDESGEAVVEGSTPAPTRGLLPTGEYVAQSNAILGYDAESRSQRPLGAAASQPSPTEAPKNGGGRTRIDPLQVPELIARANHSMSDTDPRKLTTARLNDVVSAARGLHRLADTLSSASEASETRALAERVEAMARALASYLRPRADEGTGP